MTMTSFTELQLQDYLLSNLQNSTLIRPNFNMTVFFTYSILQTLDLSNNGILSITVTVDLYWTDMRLSWDNTVYPISMTSLPLSKVWTPTLSLVNAASDSDEVLPSAIEAASVSHDGYVDILFTTKLVSTCPLSLAHFPFDEQQCNLTILSLDLGGNYEAVVSFVAIGDIDLYKQAGEFELLGMSSATSGDDRSSRYCSVLSCFSALNITLRYRRQSSYYVTSMILPACVITALIAFAFVIPTDNAVKLTMACTLMVSLYTLQQSIARILPASDQAPLLAIGMSCSLVLAGSTVLIVTLMISFKSMSPAFCKRVARLCKTGVPVANIGEPAVANVCANCKVPSYKSLPATRSPNAVAKFDGSNDSKPAWVDSIEDYLKKSIDLQEKLVAVYTAQAQSAADISNKQKGAAMRIDKSKFIDNVISLVFFVMYAVATVTCLVTFVFY